jgi:Replication-relaxation
MSPFADPPVSSSPAGIPCIAPASRSLVPMQDPRLVGRVSTRLVDEVAERLSARDLELLALTARLRVMSGAQLRELFWPEGNPATRARLARRGLARLADLSVLERLPRRIGGVRAGSSGLVFAPGRVGARLLQGEQGERSRPRRAYAPGARYLAHQLAVAQLYVDLTLAGRWGLAELLAFDPEPACWRRYHGPYGAQLTIKPDAYVRLGVGEYEHSWFIEMDMASEAPVTLVGKARRYIDFWRGGTEQATRGVFPRVAWIAPDQTRAEIITEALADLPHPELFATATAAEAVSLLTAGADS